MLINPIAPKLTVPYGTVIPIGAKVLTILNNFSTHGIVFHVRVIELPTFGDIRYPSLF